MWHPVFMISGYILGILGLVMLIPAGFDIILSGSQWSPFINSSMLAMFFGFALFMANDTKIERLSLRQGYLITLVSWVSVCAFSALPFFFYHSSDSLIDCIFEAVSGITGTGATILTDVEAMPPAILLWRSLLNYIGGLGIVIFAVALLPYLGIGGMQIFQRENSDSNDKFMPKFSYIAKRIVAVYIFLGALATGCLFLCGMGWFDAVNHAMSAVGTGGFSTKNNSVAAFDSASVETIIMLFMLAGALPMTFYILLLRRASADKNKQVRIFFKWILIYSLALSAYLYFVSDYSLAYSLRHSLFTVISGVTTTGLTSTDYILWGGWITAVFIMFSLTGGCTGSTCGSIKIFRWQVIYAFLRKYFLTAIAPHRIMPLKIGDINMPEKATMSVFVYILSFVLCLAALTVILSLCGIDFQLSLAAVTACISNTGVGSVAAIGPSGNYAFFAAPIKAILCFAMLLGRLEIITILVILSKSFWQR